MTRTWSEPRIEVQRFVADAYVAACYRIRCITPERKNSYGFTTDTWYYLYNDTNGNEVWDSEDKMIYSRSYSGFSGCNQWHEGVIQDDPPQINGFLTTGTTVGSSQCSEGIYWWQDSRGYHSTLIGSEYYETNPNAS